MSAPLSEAVAEAIKTNPIIALILMVMTPTAAMTSGSLLSQKSYATVQYVDSKTSKLEAAIANLTNSMACDNAQNTRTFLEIHKFYLNKDQKADPNNEYLAKTIQDIDGQLQEKRYIIKTRRCVL